MFSINDKRFDRWKTYCVKHKSIWSNVSVKQLHSFFLLLYKNLRSVIYSSNEVLTSFPNFFHSQWRQYKTINKHVPHKLSRYQVTMFKLSISSSGSGSFSFWQMQFNSIHKWAIITYMIRFYFNGDVAHCLTCHAGCVSQHRHKFILQIHAILQKDNCCFIKGHTPEDLHIFKSPISKREEYACTIHFILLFKTYH